MLKSYTVSLKIDRKNIPTQKHFQQIDIWLKNILYISNVDDVSSKKIEEELIQKTSLLYNKFLNTLKIPVFELPEILSIIEDKQNLEIKILLKHIDYIPTSIFNNVFNLCLKYIINYFINSSSKNNILNFYKILQKEIIQPYSHFSGTAKSSIPILETAFKMNIPIINISRGIAQLGWGCNSTMLIGSSVSEDSKIGSQIVGNKMLSAIFLKKAGLPYPIHKLLFKKEDCINAINKIPYPVVVKPCDENEGRGVTINIEDDKKLIKAFNIAKEASSSGQILVEKQVKGTCHRIFVVKQKILYVVKREPKSIKADGKSTIKELILKANEENELLPPWEKTEIFPLDEETQEVLSTYNLNLESVVQKGQWIPLRFIESSQYGGRNVDLTDKIHPENKAIAFKAARVFGMEVAGIDIISDDISIPWYENGAIINEVNFSPQLGQDNFSKNKIPIFLNSIIQNNGKIPITVIIGKQKALEEATKLQKTILDSYISYNKNEQIISLLLDKQLKHLIILVQEEQIPIDYIIDKINKLIIIEEEKKYFSKEFINLYEEKIKNKQ